MSLQHNQSRWVKRGPNFIWRDFLIQQLIQWHTSNVLLKDNFFSFFLQMEILEDSTQIKLFSTSKILPYLLGI